MVTLVQVLTPIVYLIGARGTFGFLKRKNWLVVKRAGKYCTKHGYYPVHRGWDCNPRTFQPRETSAARTSAAFAWFAWMPAVFLYKVVTARW
jgi:hypothetical protein